MLFREYKKNILRKKIKNTKRKLMRALIEKNYKSRDKLLDEYDLLLDEFDEL